MTEFRSPEVDVLLDALFLHVRHEQLCPIPVLQESVDALAPVDVAGGGRGALAGRGGVNGTWNQ